MNMLLAARSIVLAIFLVAAAAPAAFAQIPVHILQWGGPNRSDLPGQFNLPDGIATSPNGHVYVVDYGNARVQEFTDSGQLVRVIGRRGTGAGEFQYPTDVAVDADGFVYVCDFRRSCIQKFTAAGVYVTEWTDLGPHRVNMSFGPYCLTVDLAGNILAGEAGSMHIQKYTNAGNLLAEWGAEATGDGRFRSLSGLAVDAGGFVYATDMVQNRVYKFTSKGAFVTKWGGAGTVGPRFSSAQDLAVDATGRVFVSDAGNYRIAIFNADGDFLGQIGNRPLEGPGPHLKLRGLAADAQGNLYAGDQYNQCVHKFGPRVNVAPVANAGRDTVVECRQAGGSPALLDGSRSSDSNGDPLSFRWSGRGVTFEDSTSSRTTGFFPGGATLVTLTVSDGESASLDTVVVTATDSASPRLALSLSPAVLWPPNHSLVPVHATVTAEDDCDPRPAIVLLSITSNEPRDPEDHDGGHDHGTLSDDGVQGDHPDPGDRRDDDDERGDVANANLGQPDFDFELRAERAEHGAGRIYTVCYEASDGGGNRARACEEVLVPRHRGERVLLQGLGSSWALVISGSSDSRVREIRPTSLRLVGSGVPRLAWSGLAPEFGYFDGDASEDARFPLSEAASGTAAPASTGLYARWISGGSHHFAAVSLGELAGVGDARPLEFHADASPNPGRGGSIVRYTLPVFGPVTLKLYDISGRLLATPVNENQEAGRYEVPLTLDPVGGRSQILLFQLRQGDRYVSGRVLILR